MSLEENPLDALVAALADRHHALPQDDLSTYMHEIVNWNNRIALVSRRSTKSVLERLVNQSVALWDLIGESLEAQSSGAQGERSLTSFVDVGTGAGFPGIIWKMMSPASPALLIERRERKATFLDRVVRVLGLGDVEVYAGDARDAARRPGMAGAFDVAATLAVATPEDAVPLVRPFLKDSGVFATIVGSSAGAPAEAGDMRLIRSERQRTGALSVYQGPRAHQNPPA